MNTKIIRRRKNRIDDGKGYQRMIAGRRLPLVLPRLRQRSSRRMNSLARVACRRLLP